jgi:hypothetical protein
MSLSVRERRRTRSLAHAQCRRVGDGEARASPAPRPARTGFVRVVPTPGRGTRHTHPPATSPQPCQSPIPGPARVAAEAGCCLCRSVRRRRLVRGSECPGSGQIIDWLGLSSLPARMKSKQPGSARPKRAQSSPYAKCTSLRARRPPDLGRQGGAHDTALAATWDAAERRPIDAGSSHSQPDGVIPFAADSSETSSSEWRRRRWPGSGPSAEAVHRSRWLNCAPTAGRWSVRTDRRRGRAALRAIAIVGAGPGRSEQARLSDRSREAVRRGSTLADAVAPGGSVVADRLVSAQPDGKAKPDCPSVG